jgi:hypothetical protein
MDLLSFSLYSLLCIHAGQPAKEYNTLALQRYIAIAYIYIYKYKKMVAGEREIGSSIYTAVHYIPRIVELSRFPYWPSPEFFFFFFRLTFEDILSFPFFFLFQIDKKLTVPWYYHIDSRFSFSSLPR